MDQYHPQQLSTFALTLFRYNARIHGRDVAVDFWDTAGQERFTSIHPSYYHRAHVCLLVFDIQRKVTYRNLDRWYKELLDARPGIPCIVVANKIDLDLRVTSRSFNFAAKRKLPFYFVSASDGTNVVKVFEEAMRLGKSCRDAPPKDFLSEVMDLLDEEGTDIPVDASE
jgi:Rab-like protein 2